MRTTSALVLLTVLAACGDSNDTGNTPDVPVINFGTNIDTTGKLGSSTWATSIQVAVDEANAGLKQAGVNAFVFKSSLNVANVSASATAQQARSEVGAHAAVAIITDTAENDLAINEFNYDPNAKPALGAPVVCIACTSPTINNTTYVSDDAVDQATHRDASHWNFRSTMASTLEAKVLVRTLLAQGVVGDVNSDGVFKVSTYASDDAFGHELEAALRNALTVQASAGILEQIRYPANADPATYDWAGDLARLADSASESASGSVGDNYPDAIIEVSSVKVGEAIIQAYVSGSIGPALFHMHNIRTQTVIGDLGNVMNGSRGTSYVITEGVQGAAFAQRLRSATGLLPGLWDANAYDAAMAIMLASLIAVHDNAVTDTTLLTGLQVRDALLKISDKTASSVKVDSSSNGIADAVTAIESGLPIDYVGASGPMDFDNGNVRGNIAVWGVDHAEFQDVTVYDCVTNDSCDPIVQ